MSGPAGSSQWMYKTGEDFDIPYSCYFDQTAAESNLRKTYGSDGNRRTWTFSFWHKRAAVRNRGLTAGWYGPQIFTAEDGGDDANECAMTFMENGYLRIMDSGGAAGYMRHETTREFRDPNAWYHIVIACDTTQNTDTDRFKLWINGDLITDYRTTQHQTQNNYTGWGAAQGHRLGGYESNPGAGPMWGYLAECHFLDGAAVTAASFGETGDYGEWKPIEYNVADGAYGTNGFYINFSNASNLGEDFSGEGNDYTTHGPSCIQNLDSPTNNWCTWNLLRTSYQGTSEGMWFGSLLFRVNNGDNSSSGDRKTAGTFPPITSGKWYWEISPIEIYFNDLYTQPEFGLIGASDGVSHDGNNTYKTTWDYEGATDNLSGATFSTYAQDDILAIAYNADDDEVTFYKANVAETTTALQATDSQGMEPLAMDNYGGKWIVNFGQDSSFANEQTAQGNQDENGYGDFYYTPPTGYLALCAKNLDEPAVKPKEHFKAITYTGDGNTGRAITGVGFQPDIVWIKARTSTNWRHWLTDVVRGVTKVLHTGRSDAEGTETDAIQSFDSDGFTIDDNAKVNTNNDTLVAWCWKLAGTAVANSEGSQSCTVSANTDAGVSVVRWEGSSGGTVGHGLNSTPELTMRKNLTSPGDDDNWIVTYNFVDGTEDVMSLDISSGSAANSAFSAPTSTLLNLGTADNNGGQSGEYYVAYCFHSVPGFSKFGSYKGNNIDDGIFVNCGFRPAYVCVKNTHSWAGHWVTVDSARSPVNTRTRAALLLNEDDVESTSTDYWIEFVSNGFKCRDNSDDINITDGGANYYIYMAFAEVPFKYANAR